MRHTNIRNLDVSMLRTFDALMRERSVSRAATRLFLSQPAVSQSLGRLRQAFNDPLFTRTPHGVSPTPKAFSLAEQVAGILADMEQLLQNAQGGFVPATAERSFRVAGGDYVFSCLMPALAAHLHQHAPGIQIQWLSVDFVNIDQQLAHKEIDFALMPRIAPRSDAHSLSLYEDTYCLVLAKGHPLAQQASLSASDFCNVPHAILGSGTFRLETLIDENLARLGLQRQRSITVATMTQLLELVRHGVYGAVIPRRLATLHRSDLHDAGMPLDLPTYTLQLCQPPQASNDEGATWMRQLICELIVERVENTLPLPAGIQTDR